MVEQTGFDEQAAHRHFAAHCFNRAWDFIEKPDRSKADDEEMIRLTHVSHWHWTQVTDHTPTNISIACWQTSRIYAMLGRAEDAGRYARLCLTASRSDGVEPFYRAYAREAMARAASIQGIDDAARENLAQARRLAETIDESESKRQLLRDLDSIA